MYSLSLTPKSKTPYLAVIPKIKNKRVPTNYVDTM